MARLDLVGSLEPVYNLSGALTDSVNLSGTLSFTNIQYLYQLQDVHITSPANGDTLIYNAVTQEWENGAGTGGTDNYNDLYNKPQINNVTLSGNKTTADLGLFSGDYTDLTNKPTIPSHLYQLSDVHYHPDEMFNDDILIWVNGGWYPSTQSYQLLANKPEINSHTLTGNKTTADLGISYNDLIDLPVIPAAQVNADWDAVSGVEEILNKPTLSTVATSGSYNDLIDQPTIPAAQVNSDWDALSGVAQILNKPSLSTVATSGSYNDLTDKPTIPDGLHHYSTTEQQVGVWVDGTTPVYEKTYTFNSAISCSAGNTSAAGAWTSLVSWNDSITIIDFKAWSNSGSAKTVWTHLSAQWSNTNLDIRALNIRSTAAPVDGFTMRYFYN